MNADAKRLPMFVPRRPAKRRNKQHDARGASFKRIAKSYRDAGLNFHARIFEAEAKTLRGMR